MSSARFVVRRLRQSPLFVLAAVTSLALGVGVNAAIVHALFQVYAAPLGIAEPRQVVRIELFDVSSGRTFGPLEGTDWTTTAESLDGVAEVTGFRSVWSVGLKWAGITRRVQADAVAPGFFDLLGVRPELGRFFATDDEVRGGVVLSHALWRTRFGADEGILHQTVLLDAQPFQVLGVAEPAFKGIHRWRDPHVVWLQEQMLPTIDPTAADTSPGHRMTALARLVPGTTMASLEARLASTRFAGLAAIESRWDRRLRVGATPVLEGARVLRENQSRGAWLVAVAGALVLLLTCANVSHLLLARGLRRSRELALRRALGARGRDLVKLQAAESAAVAALALALAVPLAVVLLQRLWSLRPPLVTEDAMDIAPGPSLILVSVATAAIALLAASALPALAAARARTLGSPGSTRRRRTTRSVLVGTQIAIAAVVLVGATLALTSLRNLRAIPLGFEPQRLLLFGYDFSKSTQRAQDVRATMPRLLDLVGDHPAVESAALSTMHFGATVYSRVIPDGRGDDEFIMSSANGVSEHFFDVLGTPLLSGRGFTSGDHEDSTRVVVVSETFADRAWPGESALGRRVELIDEDRVVVGVVADAKLRQVDEEANAQVYYPLSQRFESQQVVLTVRVRGAPAAARRELEQMLQRATPDRSVAAGQWSDWVDGSLWGPRAASSLLGGLGAVALLLAVVGLYSTLVLWLSERHGELAIRSAVGAAPGQLAALLLRAAVTLGACGVGVGLAVALAASRLAEGLLFGLSPSTAGPYVAVGAALMLVAIVAAAVPALRAGRTDPIVALRTE